MGPTAAAAATSYSSSCSRTEPTGIMDLVSHVDNTQHYTTCNCSSSSSSSDTNIARGSRLRCVLVAQGLRVPGLTWYMASATANTTTFTAPQHHAVCCKFVRFVLCLAIYLWSARICCRFETLKVWNLLYSSLILKRVAYALGSSDAWSRPIHVACRASRRMYHQKCYSE